MHTNNWNALARLLHWTVALLVVAAVAAVWSHELFSRDNPLRATLMQSHFALGLLIGVLTLVRLGARLYGTAPAHAMPQLVARFARLGHAGLYVLLLALPLAGYLACSGDGRPLDLFGAVQLPPLALGADLADAMEEVHETLAYALISLVTLHTAAALYHLLVLRDQVLQSMLGRAPQRP